MLGSCLVAASAAVAADQPARFAAPPPAGASNDAEVGTAVANSPVSKAADIAVPRRVGLAADYAPDPPGLRRPDALLAVFQQDSDAAPTRPATGAPAASRPAEPSKAAESPSGDVVAPPPPAQLPETAAAAGLQPAALSLGTTSAAASAPAAAKGESPASLPLGSHADKNAPGKGSPLSAMISVAGSLAIVLGLFLVVAWAMRKTAPRGSLALPPEVFEILGRAPLGARQQVQLLRCGKKLLLVSITPDGAETLTEVTDPLEVDRLAGICQQAHPKSSTASFRQVFQQLAPGTPGRGEPSELDNLEPSGPRRRRYRWEEKNV
jgi:flagellar biogenesis protein FliO